MPQESPDSSPRVNRIMARVRTETATRDVVVFGIGRLWLVLLELLAVLYKAISRHPSASAETRQKSPSHDL